MRRTDSRIVLGLYRSRHLREGLEAAIGVGVDALDTSFNYLNFSSHSTLAQVAGDLLSHFTISTKVGFFPAAGRVEHSLDPDRLRESIMRSADDLRCSPDIVFLHNPEQTLSTLTEDSAADALSTACSTLEEASQKGICDSWGISTWNPTILANLLAKNDGTIFRPAALMTRCGLLVGSKILDSIEKLTGCCESVQRWGMSPFAGHASSPVLDTVNLGQFFKKDQEFSSIQAAFRLAFELPNVGRIAVGADKPEHLRELAAASELVVDTERIDRYRELLRTTQAS